MAKKLRFNYTFTPGAANAGTVVVSGYVSIRRLLLITNVTRNIILFNFSDTTLGATVSYNSTTDQTTFTLATSTTGQSSADNLQIFTEEDAVAFTPSDVLQDPTNKLRTASPQALIDTDFEYGTQISKWENLGTINGRPFTFQNQPGISSVQYILMPTNSNQVSVGLVTTGPGIGTMVYVQDSLLSFANGNFVVESTSGVGNTIFTYTARATNNSTITQLFDPFKTGISSGFQYSGFAIGSGVTYASSGYAVTVTTSIPHGLSLGSPIAILGSSATANAPNGNLYVAGINSSTQFVAYASSIPNTITSGVGSVFVRPSAQFLHRPFDGGVYFSTFGASNYESATRQTRRYFRYQSGKGIQMSSGTVLKPNIQIDSLSSSGTTVTVQTKEGHNIQYLAPGTSIIVSGANETAYNGTFLVTSVTGFNKFTYTASSTPSATPASGNYNLSINSWYGATNRLGIFDAQNGMYFEYDGTTAYVVRRNSTYQISGRITVNNGSSIIYATDATNFPTAFTRQLNVGDSLVLRGQTYRIIDITNDSQLSISPSFKGPSSTYVIPSKIVETRVPQSQWNLDTCDGNGPSGYNIDFTKMQMFYIDYTWYGAGFIRWGLRGPTGDVIYCHKLRNNNVNTEAYMRSGNLPARYESTLTPAITYLSANVGAADTYVGIASTAGFSALGGVAVIRNPLVWEYINYTGIGTTALTGVTRGKAGGITAVTVAANSNSLTSVGSTIGLQVGQRIINNAFPAGTFISSITSPTTITLSNSSTGALTGVAVTFPAMGAASGQAFTAGIGTVVESAFPTFAPALSHWGTSVIMDGRFDEDKSLIFTYGQTLSSVSIGASDSRALFSIRIAPSVDSGIAAGFGARELTNRMQLTLKTLDLSVVGVTTANLLVRAYINAVPTFATPWTNAVGNVTNSINSSLAQIADYSVSPGAATTVRVTGGEVTGGYWVSQTGSTDISQIRDLGNSILGGGGANANTQIYPDGPDVLTIVVTNVSTTPTSVYGRISWTEAQA
jgi:hypothetical protein